MDIVLAGAEASLESCREVSPEVSSDLSDLSGASDVEIGRLTERAEQFLQSSKAAETLRGYRIDWKDFTGWCQRHGRESLPASLETVALYLTDEASHHKPATLQRRLASISQAHSAAGFAESPTKSALVRSVWQGIRREKGVARQGKTPTLVPDLIRMLHELPPDKLIGKRDRALLLVGFAGAFRRSEVVGLEVSDLAFQEGQGIVVTLKRSKTDQEGGGQKVGIPFGQGEETCPVRALQAWLSAAAIVEGPVFRAVDRHGNVSASGMCGRSVARVVQRSIGKTGKDARQFGGHSLRSGLATSAAMAGKSMNAIMGQTRHKSEAMVRLYIREGSLFRDNAAQGLGL
jgi:integrase